MDDNEDLLATLAVERALTELITRYCRGIDRCDRELILSCYHPDGVEDHGPFVGGDPETFVNDVVERHRSYSTTEHSVSNMRFEIKGDLAFGETYVIMRRLHEGKPVFGWGRYLDRFERRNGEWRIAHRRVLMEGLSPELGIEADFSASRKDRGDPSYDFRAQSTVR